MIYDTFKQKLRKLNPRLKIFETHEAEKGPWGLYELSPMGTSIEHICGVSVRNGIIYENTERRWDGYILRQGWRRIIKILISKKLVDRHKAAKVFSTSFDGNRGNGFVMQKDPLTKAWNEAKARGFQKTGDSNFVELDDMIDIHRMREQFRKDKSNYWA